LTRPITRKLKDAVIFRYLKGESRNENAINTGLGAGTVTAIIQEFNNELAEYEPEAIRELTEQLRKAGISPNDCVRGAQMINKMSDLGIDKDKCLAVIETVQTRIIQKGVPPEKCAEIVSQLFEISQSESMPLNEIPDYSTQKVQEKEGLDAEVDIQQMHIQNLKKQVDTQLQQNNLTTQNIASYLDMRRELANLWIPETDIERTTNVIRNLSEQGFDVKNIVEIASTTRTLKEEVSDLNKQRLSIQITLSQYDAWIPLLQDIIELGGGAIGPNELGVLVDSIRWRATKDKVPTMVAAQTIMGQIQDLYRVIGFEKETKSKQAGLLFLEEKIKELDEFWAGKLKSIDALTYLTARGVTNENVIEFHKILFANQNKINFTTLVEDLQRYVSMKQLLNQIEEDIKKKTYQSKALHLEVISLLEDRERIESENASMHMWIDSLKKQTHPAAGEHALKAKTHLPEEEKGKGRIENSPRAIIDPAPTISPNTKSRSEHAGNGTSATTEKISSISNPQSAKAKTTSTITSSEEAGIHNQSDTQSSATETKTNPTS